MTQFFKLGDMVIDSKQVFWKKDLVFACIPFVQLLKGLTPKRNVLNYKDLQINELFELTLTIKFVSKSLQTYFGCNSTTIYIQQDSKDSNSVGQLMVHILPRKNGDFKKQEQLYDLLQKYQGELTKYYNQKIASYGNAFVGKILEGINEEKVKYEEYMNSVYKDEQSF